MIGTEECIMQFDWRAISGPTVTIATALIAVVVDGNSIVVSNLAPLFVCIAALSAALSGIAPGLISTVIAVAFTVLLVRDQGINAANVAHLISLTVAASGAAVVTGVLRQRMIDALVRQRGRHATAERLAAALDRIDIGVVLLDSDTRAEFVNRAFRDYFLLPDAKADSKPPFIALMYHGRDTGAYEMPEQELSAFVAERIRLVRAGDATPININLANGQVLRFRCTALPDGGRMLSYTPVTDLVRHTDHPTDTDYYLSLRGGGDQELTRLLRAAE
jgi:PAS domain-containing protein